METIWDQMLEWWDFKMEAPWQLQMINLMPACRRTASGFAFHLKALISHSHPILWASYLVQICLDDILQSPSSNPSKVLHNRVYFLLHHHLYFLLLTLGLSCFQWSLWLCFVFVLLSSWAIICSNKLGIWSN